MSKKLLYFLAFLTIGVYGQIPTDQLIKEFLFINGNLNNSSTTPIGGALITAGSARTTINDYLNTASALQLNGDSFNASTRGANNSKVVSLSFWVKTNTNTTTAQSIIRQYGSGSFLNNGVTNTTNYGWYVDLHEGKIRITTKYLDSTTGTHTSGIMSFRTGTVSSNVIADNNWHHVVVMLAPLAGKVEARIYIDGGTPAALAIGAIRSTNPNHYILNPPGRIIEIAATNNKYSDGIDNLRVYNKELNTTEITNLKNELSRDGIVYVDPTATGNNSGNSWSNAYTNLPDALASVYNKIWVKSGVYKPGVTNRSATFLITSDKQIYGGFSGTETNLSQRDIEANPTIFSGDLNSNDNGNNGYSNPLRVDNSYHVFTINPGVSTFLLDGVTVSGGHANGVTTSESQGAGIYKVTNSHANITIKNCIIKENTANFGAGFYASYNSVGGQLLIEKSQFLKNISASGAAFFLESSQNQTVRLDVYTSLFANNSILDLVTQAGSSGSSGWLKTDGTATLVANFVNNTYANETNTGANTVVSDKGIMIVGKETSTSVMAISIYNSIFDTSTAGVNAINTEGFISPDNVFVFNSLSSTDNFPLATTSSGNIQTTASFVDAANNNFFLQASSAAVDAGINHLFVTSKIPVDLLGNPRIYNGTVDMGAYEYAPGTLSVNKVSKLLDFSVYPNPAKELIKLNLSEELKKAEVYNFSGQKVKTSLIKTININDLSTGVYFLKITTENNKIGIKKFIKK